MAYCSLDSTRYITVREMARQVHSIKRRNQMLDFNFNMTIDFLNPCKCYYQGDVLLFALFDFHVINVLAIFSIRTICLVIFLGVI